jgi:uncharacterized protein (TIGR02246 family)
MKTRLLCLLALLAIAFALTASRGTAQPGKIDPKEEEAALMKRAEAFVDAFHKGDAKAVAAFWTPDGDYTDQTGLLLKGRAAIEKAFTEFFAEHKGLKLRINITGLRFVTPDVAIEDGTTEVILPDGGPPNRARYTNVHVKKDSQWYLASVRDAPYAPPTNYQHLRELEWLIGSWADDPNAKGEIFRVSFTWGENQNFMLSSYTSTFKNIHIGGATQWIGWDGAAKQIRSWTFETGGSFGEGTWTRDGNRWTIKTVAVLKDGKKVTATNILTRVDANTMTWHSKDRAIDGKALPEVKEITLKRVQ